MAASKFEVLSRRAAAFLQLVATLPRCYQSKYSNLIQFRMTPPIIFSRTKFSQARPIECDATRTRTRSRNATCSKRSQRSKSSNSDRPKYSKRRTHESRRHPFQPGQLKIVFASSTFDVQCLRSSMSSKFNVPSQFLPSPLIHVSFIDIPCLASLPSLPG